MRDGGVENFGGFRVSGLGGFRVWGLKPTRIRGCCATFFHVLGHSLRLEIDRLQVSLSQGFSTRISVMLESRCMLRGYAAVTISLWLL